MRLFTDGFEVKSTARWSGSSLSFNNATKYNANTSGSMQLSGSTTATLSGAFAATAEFYWRANYRLGGIGAAHYPVRWFKGANELGSVRINSGSNKLELWTGTSAGGTLRATGSTALAANTWYTIEVHGKIDGAVGVLELKVNRTAADSTLEASFSGNTKPGADANIDTIEISLVSGNSYLDDCALNDTTGTLNNAWNGVGVVYAKQITGYGNYAEWSGNVAGGADNITPSVAIDSTDIIKDDTDGSGVAFTGSWTAQSTLSPYLGTSHFIGNAVGTGTNKCTYTPTLPADGYYEIFEWHPASSNRLTTCNHVITLQDGTTTTVNVNQQINGGQWNSIGIFHLGGTGGAANAKLVINDNGTGSGTYVFADGIRFIQVPDAVTYANRARVYEFPPDTVGNLQTNTIGKRDTYKFGGLPADVAAINLVEVVIVAKATGTPTPTTVTGMARISGADYLTAGTVTPGVSDAYQEMVFDQNPATSGAWAKADVDAAEFGIKATA